MKNFTRLLICFVVLLLTGRVAAQSQLLKGGWRKDTVRMTATQGTVSATDTLLFEQGRLGGRFFVYFQWGQAKWFKIDPSLKDKFMGHKLKAYHTLRIPVVFCPPPGFVGEAHTTLLVQGISGTPWIAVEMVGSSTLSQ